MPWGEEVTVRDPNGTLLRHADKHAVAVDPLAAKNHLGPARLAEELFGELVVATLRADLRARLSGGDESADPGTPVRGRPLAEKWDLYVNGFDLATGYSELVDPVIQRERLVTQSILAAGGDPDAMQLDEPFPRDGAGHAPSGGMGMGH
jgi:lysyl-tRNA synthetase class 2